MNNEKNIEIKCFSIPVDLFIDVMKVLLTQKLKSQVVGVNEQQGLLILNIETQNENQLHQKAIENISEFLSDYGFFV